jgi:hypothetical protein
MFRLLLLALFLAPYLLTAQEYSHGDPTAEEQLLLEMINRARADAKAEGDRLMDTPDQSVQQAYTYWQIDKAKTRTAFNGYPNRPPLAFHPALITAARLHSADMVAKNFQGHVGSNGSQLGQRLSAQGYTSMGQYGENVATYATSVWYAHCGFNVDWGTQNQIDLGHRSNIMNFSGAVYTECGIGIQRTNGGLQFGTVGPLVTTEDFGIQSRRYITGVVYEDRNNNGFYDVGEGLAGVKVQPSRGSYWAMTSTSGGYAIPFSGNGAVSVVASGGALAAAITQNATFIGDNIKVDFVSAAQVPAQVVLSSPANNAAGVDPAGPELKWSSVASAEQYQLQVATANTFATATLLYDQTGGLVSATAPKLQCGTKYYWRVRGINSIGPGAWSTVFSFTTSGTSAGSTTLAGPKGNTTFDNMGTIDCAWSAANGATVYHIRFSKSGSFSQVFAEDSSITTLTFKLPTAALPPGGAPFYWQVRAGNTCGWGAWSSFNLVTPTITDVAEQTTAPYQLSISPNPVREDAVVAVGGPLVGPVVITVMNLQGGLEMRTDVVAMNGLEISLSKLGLEALVSGVYVLRIEQGDTAMSRMFNVVR